MKQSGIIQSLIVIALLSVFSCKNYRNAYKKNFDFPPPDTTKFDKTDGNSGKLFDLLTAKSTGLDFNNLVRFGFLEDNNFYVNYYNGGGVAILNVNGDSLPDVYMTGNVVADKLFINEGNLHFNDVSEAAGIPTKDKGWSTGVSIVDINSDGYDDIYVCRSKIKDSLSNLFYVNDGNGHYVERGAEFGIDCADCYTMGAVFFDYDNDGDMDLYVKNHPSDYVERMRFNNLEKVEQNKNQSDKFFRNDNGHFTDISKQAGINNHGYGLAVCAADLNNDGWVDVYGCNDFAMYDYIYKNNGNGTFTDVSRDWLTKSSFFSMGVDVADFNRDGWLDIVTADMRFNHSALRRSFALGLRRNEFNNMITSGYGYQYVKNTLQVNNGNNTFSDIANLAGVDATDWSWGPLFADFDNDGWKDIFIPNGYYRWLNVDERELYQAMRDATRRKDTVEYKKYFDLVSKKKLIAPNYIFRNNGDYTFATMNETWGINLPTITHGAAFADLDNDGDVDMIASNTDEGPFLYRNNSEKLSQNHWVKFQFKGNTGNSAAIGTKVYIWSESGMQFDQHHTVRGYQSTSENFIHFGLGADDSISRVVIVWPDGKTNEVFNLTPNRPYSYDYMNATNNKVDITQKQNPMFADATRSLGIDFLHTENEYDDFTKEILLPHKMSRLGPGLAVADVNGDGLEDFFVGGALRDSSSLILQTSDQTFQKSLGQPWDNDKQHEILGVLFFDADADGDKDLYACTGGSEFKRDDPNLRDILYMNDGKGNFSENENALPSINSSGSCIVAGDYDSDGDQDLFIGGRVIPANFPFPAQSVLLRNDKGKFTDVTKDICPELEKAGLVCSAVWVDYNNDNKTDLLVTGEFMPVTIFKNETGKLINHTQQAGLENSTGWWLSLVPGDFDNDGDLDFVAGNEGLNSRYYQPSAEQPIECFASDFDNNGTNDVVLSVYNHNEPYPIKTRMTITEQVPMIGEKFPLYKQFALANVNQVFGEEALNKSYHLTAKTLASSYIENKGDGTFTIRPLPMMAQFSCIYGMVVYDVNQDGNLDVVAHGNFYSTETESERQDAGTGLILRGDGKGNFTPLTSIQTGFFSHKDAKALALIHIGEEKNPVIIGTNNNDRMFAFSLLADQQQKIMVNENDSYAEIFFSDGRKQRYPVVIGSGYLSQSSIILSFIPSLVEKIVVTDFKGNERTIYQGSTLASK